MPIGAGLDADVVGAGDDGAAGFVTGIDEAEAEAVGADVVGADVVGADVVGALVGVPAGDSEGTAEGVELAAGLELAVGVDTGVAGVTVLPLEVKVPVGASRCQTLPRSYDTK
jgi:hypothetical protein